MHLKILVVDDDPLMHKLIKRILETSKFAESRIVLVHCGSPKSAIEAFYKNGFHAALIDLHYKGISEDGFYLLQKLKKIDEGVELVVMSSQNEFSAAQKALRAGANDFLVKGFGREELEHALNAAMQRRKWKAIEHKEFKNNLGIHKIIGESASIRKLKEQILKVASSEIPVLIEAETGSGKELVARSIHEERGNPALPFIAVDCGAIPKGLADSYFFGHEKGAFTSADSIREGIFESADGGTLFLDEINSLALDMQAKLLRVLQEREFRRLGSNKVRSADFRLVSASNASLAGLVENKEFREDLYYRLNAIRLAIPPLRERTNDLKLLVHFLLPHRKVSGSLIQEWKRYRWPGNIRELKNILLALDVLVDKELELTAENIPEEIRYRLSSLPIPEAMTLEKIRAYGLKEEVNYFRNTYLASKGNISKMARALQLDRSHLHQKLVRLGIHQVREG